MEIQTVTRYVYKDKEYKTLKEVKDIVENTIGEEVIDKINKQIDIRHKDLLILHNILCSKEVRNVLLDCFGVNFERYNEDKEEYEFVNILDL